MTLDRTLLTKTHDTLFAEHLHRVLDLKIPLANGGVYMTPSVSEARIIYKNLVDLAAKHLEDVGFKTVVVPASGGADSTFMLCLLRAAADLLRDQDKKYPQIVGFTLPCTLQEDAEYLDDMGKWACELYADEYASVNIGPAHAAVMEALFDLDNITMSSGRTANELFKATNPDYPVREFKVDRGNAAARLRMIFSYGIAKMLGGAQCSTDNLSEGLTGFWTLCGDEGTFKYMQSIWKGLELPILMSVAGIPTPFFMQKPTDGLGVGDGDVAQYYGDLYDGTQTYVDVDITLIRYLGGESFPDPGYPSVPVGSHPVVQWHKRTQFKRTPFSLGRSDLGLTKIPGLELAT